MTCQEVLGQDCKTVPNRQISECVIVRRTISAFGEAASEFGQAPLGPDGELTGLAHAQRPSRSSMTGAKSCRNAALTDE
jgi:hypothetical protein